MFEILSQLLTVSQSFNFSHLQNGNDDTFVAGCCEANDLVSNTFCLGLVHSRSSTTVMVFLRLPGDRPQKQRVQHGLLLCFSCSGVADPPG